MTIRDSDGMQYGPLPLPHQDVKRFFNEAADAIQRHQIDDVAQDLTDLGQARRKLVSTLPICCGCRTILMIDGTHEIAYCPLHAAAPVMLAALEGLCKPAMIPLCGADANAWGHAIVAARDAIAQ